MKTTLTALAALILVSSSAFAIDLGAKTGLTPYDRYMTPVKSVLSQIRGAEDNMTEVRSLMRVGRNFRYSYTTPYTANLPGVTAARHAGDCKDKALWLLSAIKDESARFVIGKARRSSEMSHAWVMWKHEGRWWILDCTNKRDPIPADRVSRNEYIPMYSFAKNGTFRHAPAAEMLFAAKRGRHTNPVASNLFP